MRKLLALVPLAAAIASLVACSGGGGSVSSPASPATPGSGSVPTSQYVTPKFTITIPARGASKARKPQFVSSGTLSVKITLTADTNGVDPTTLANNPALTNVNGTSGLSCTSGCTVLGPPVPPGMDTFTVTTYDATTGNGNALDQTPVGGTSFQITTGTSPSETLTLLGIPSVISMNSAPSLTAGTASDTTIGPLSSLKDAVTVLDADDETITGTYAYPVTVSDSDTNGDGTSVASSCPGTYPTGNTAQAATSVMFLTSSDTAHFCYGGLAESNVSITASVQGSSHQLFAVAPILSAPVYVAGSGTPTYTVSSSGAQPDVALFSTTGIGSTGSLNYSEAGFTEDPYDQILTAAATTACSSGGPFSMYATVAATGVTGASGSTQFTVTAISSATPGACPLTVADGITGNPSDATAVFDTSYTSSGVGVNARAHAKQR